MNKQNIEPLHLKALACCCAAAFFCLASILPADCLGQASRSRARSNGPVINVEFNGGSLLKYIEYLRSRMEENDGALNVILDDSAKQLLLPSISFKNVHLSAAVEIIEQLNLDDYRVSVDVNNSIYVIEAYPKKNHPGMLGSMMGGGGVGITTSPMLPTASKPLETVVLSVSDILKDKSTQDLLSAIEIGLQLVAEASDAKAILKLHEETGLLFAKGDEQQLKIVSDTVQQLARHKTNSATDFSKSKPEAPSSSKNER